MFGVAAPSARRVYAASLVIGGISASISAWQLNVFVLDPHPDPTRGSLGLALTIVFGLVAAGGAATALILLRWFLWPAQRTALWNAQAAVVTAAVASLAATFLWALMAARSSRVPPSPWSPSPFIGLRQDGSEVRRFPKEGVSTFECIPPSEFSTLTSRVALVVEGSSLYRCTGYVVSYCNAEVQTFPTVAAAKVAMAAEVAQLRDRACSAVPGEV